MNTVERAKEIRKELKIKFPGVKFSVRTKKYSGGSSISVSWIDFPTAAAVEEITNKYKSVRYDEYTKYFIYKDNTFMSVKPGKDYPSGYYNHVRSYNYKVDHVNKIILFTDKEIEEVEPIKEEFYNNNNEAIEAPAAEETDNYFYSDINLNNILKHIEEVKDFNNSKSVEYFGSYGTQQRGSFRIEKNKYNDNNLYINAMLETKENYFEKLEIFEEYNKAIDLYIEFLSKYQLDYIKYLENQKEQTKDNYITLTKEQEKERIDLINLWSKKAPGDKEQGKERFLQLLFEYQEQKKTKEEFKKHINKLYAANKNIKAANAGKKDFNNYLIDLLATENILQQNDIIKNEFFTNAYNYIKSVS